VLFGDCLIFYLALVSGPLGLVHIPVYVAIAYNIIWSIWACMYYVCVLSRVNLRKNDLLMAAFSIERASVYTGDLR